VREATKIWRERSSSRVRHAGAAFFFTAAGVRADRWKRHALDVAAVDDAVTHQVLALDQVLVLDLDPPSPIDPRSGGPMENSDLMALSCP